MKTHFFLNPFTPAFLKWAHSSLNLDTSIVENRGFSLRSRTMANSVHPDETARYEPSHLDLHCLQRYMCKSAGMKGLKTSRRRFRQQTLSCIIYS